MTVASPMRVAMVSEHASPLATLGGVDAGGQNVHVAELARALTADGHHVVVHTRRDDPNLPEWVDLCPGVTVHHVAAGPAEPIGKDSLLPYMDAFGVELARVWSDNPPDVVHAHFWMSGLAALAGARAAPNRPPVVQTYHALGVVKRRHQGTADTSPPQRWRAELMIGRSCQRVIATCRDEVDELRRMGVAAPVSVVPCGVDAGRFSPARGRRSGRPRFLALGRLVPRKGVDTVIRALALVPDAELTVAGGPPAGELVADPEARRLMGVAEEAGVSDRVRFLGGVPADRVPDLVRDSDAVVSGAHYEPFGIVPLEAMACGVPMVATAVGGHLDTVVDRGTGRLVPPRDPGALADALREVAHDPDLARAWGRAGRRRVLQRFTWPAVARATAAAYAEVLGGTTDLATAVGGDR